MLDVSKERLIRNRVGRTKHDDKTVFAKMLLLLNKKKYRNHFC